MLLITTKDRPIADNWDDEDNDVRTIPNVKYSPFFQSNANQPMPLNADWLRIGRKCQCLTNPFEMDRIGNFGLEPQKKPIQNQSLIIKPMLRNPAANSLPI